MKNFTWIDLFCISLANLFNILLIGIMLARPIKQKRLEYILGLISSSIFVPLLLVAGYIFVQQRSMWLVVLPGFLGIFCLVEFLLDYVFKFPFRQTRWLGPYLLFFYASQWGMIGFAFIFSKITGIITLFTYFLSLGATAYSYKQVGHGPSKMQKMAK